MTTPAQQQTANGHPAGGLTLPSGAVKWSTEYFDGDSSPKKRSAGPVPVNQFMQITGQPWRCRRCEPVVWYPAGLKGVPVCPVHARRMEQAKVRRAPLVPVRALWSAAERPLRPVWALPALAAAGVMVDAGHVPALVLAGAAVGSVPAVTVAARRLPAVRGWLGEHADVDAAVQRASRELGLLAGGVFGWLAAAGAGLTGHSWPVEALTWGVLAGLWLLPAATWWRRLRTGRLTPAPVPGPARERSADEIDAEAAAQTWREDVAVDGTRMVASSWRRIPCGWQAVVEATRKGALNPLGGDLNTQTIRRIAAAYDVPFSAVTWIEAFEDSPNRAQLLVQPSNPLAAGQVWGGPDTIDVGRARAESGRLINGETMWDTLWRPGWGAPSEVVLGTTGGGKSARIRKKMIVERWSSFKDAGGIRRGLFVTLLHDPKRLESYAEFRDAIHGYGITRDDAHIIIDALLREMFRRYDFISGLEWRDAKGRARRGGLAWNPLVHGPIISHYWDEFHELASDNAFVAKLEKLARYQRACMMRGTLASHMGTIGDTGSQALRDMLAGGRATLFRTTSALNAALVTGGQLTGDPRTLPRLPGMCYVADGETATLMGRESYIPGGEEPGNVYDWLFDPTNEPIGFPADIPPETAEAFGEEFMQWMEAGRSPQGRSERPRPPVEHVMAHADVKCEDAVLAQLVSAVEPMDVNELSARLTAVGCEFKTRTISGALKGLREKRGLVFSSNGRHELTPQARAELQARSAEAEQVRAGESE